MNQDSDHFPKKTPALQSNVSEMNLVEWDAKQSVL